MQRHIKFACCAVHRFVESANNPRTDPVVLWMVGCNVNVVSVADPNVDRFQYHAKRSALGLV